ARHAAPPARRHARRRRPRDGVRPREVVQPVQLRRPAAHAARGAHPHLLRARRAQHGRDRRARARRPPPRAPGRLRAGEPLAHRAERPRAPRDARGARRVAPALLAGGRAPRPGARDRQRAVDRVAAVRLRLPPPLRRARPGGGARRDGAVRHRAPARRPAAHARLRALPRRRLLPGRERDPRAGRARHRAPGPLRERGLLAVLGGDREARLPPVGALRAAAEPAARARPRPALLPHRVRVRRVQPGLPADHQPAPAADGARHHARVLHDHAHLRQARGDRPHADARRAHRVPARGAGPRVRAAHRLPPPPLPAHGLRVGELRAPPRGARHVVRGRRPPRARGLPARRPDRAGRRRRSL
ncbi:MAG: hypothetical protein AVDCRST_MAG11-2282, partial [uncultured Gemmatimonadaceae bacterium]